MNKFLLLFVMALVLTGAGCGKKEAIQNKTDASSGSSDLVSRSAKVSTEADFRVELKQALKNFQEAKSFKADLVMKVAGNELNATLSVAKPNRFKGVVKTKEAAMEIILVEEDMYLRMNDGNWTKFASTAKNKAIIESVKKSINGESSLENMGVDEAKPITKMRRSDKECDVYETELTTASGGYQAVKICIDKELPKILETRTEDGSLTMKYYDINSVFLIERPTK